MVNVEFAYMSVNSTPVVGKGVFALIKFFSGFWDRISLLRNTYRLKNVKVVIGFGGYPAVLPCLAALSLFIPTLIFEQNGQAGNANRLLAFFATKVFAVPGVVGLSFRKKTFVLNPVRDEIREFKKSTDALVDGPLKVLVLGGSQGAVSLNTAILDLKNLFSDGRCQLIHQVGAFDLVRMTELFSEIKNVTILPYIEDMAGTLSQADIVICRAGAGTVSELTSIKKPAIFVPLAIAQGHQRYNALHLVKGGAALMFDQNENLSKYIRENLELFINDRELLRKMERAYNSVPELEGVEDGAAIISSQLGEYLKRE